MFFRVIWTDFFQKISLYIITFYIMWRDKLENLKVSLGFEKHLIICNNLFTSYKLNQLGNIFLHRIKDISVTPFRCYEFSPEYEFKRTPSIKEGKSNATELFIELSYWVGKKFFDDSLLILFRGCLETVISWIRFSIRPRRLIRAPRCPKSGDLKARAVLPIWSSSYISYTGNQVNHNWLLYHLKWT